MAFRQRGFRRAMAEGWHRRRRSSSHLQWNSLQHQGFASMQRQTWTPSRSRAQELPCFGVAHTICSGITQSAHPAPPSTSASVSEKKKPDCVTAKQTRPDPPLQDHNCDRKETMATLEVQKMEGSFMGISWRQLLGFGPALQAVASMSREEWAKKLTQWKIALWEALQHYWVGTKLLWADVRISSRLLLKLAVGKTLIRRERKQLSRTTADIFRLVPFAVFIIVPFMEFLLPVVLKAFPDMLPSTFQDKLKEQDCSAGACERNWSAYSLIHTKIRNRLSTSQLEKLVYCRANLKLIRNLKKMGQPKQEALKKRLNARIQYAKFLQDTVKEMAKEIQTTRSGDAQRTAEDLDEFMNKVRKGDEVSNDEILGFAKLFNDELTLDNISRPRLVSMCKYMGIKPYGTDAYLRYMLRSKLTRIKYDDKLIQSEGLESLSELELRAACRDRGMLGLLSVEEMRHQLKDWLDLSLKHSLPSSLLLLSRSFLVSGNLKPEEAVQATLSSLPDEVVGTVSVTKLPSEDALAERKRKLEYIHMQEELIKEETGKGELQERKKEDVRIKDYALNEMSIATTTHGTEEFAKKKALERQESLCKLSNALALLASSSSMHKERAAFLRLVNKEIEQYNILVHKVGKEGVEEARRAYKVAHDERVKEAVVSKVSSALIERVNALLHELEKELDDADARIAGWRLLDKDSDGKVTPEELVAAAVFLKDSLGQVSLQDLISKLDKDKDGNILLDDIMKLGASVDPNNMHAIKENNLVQQHC